VAATVTQLGARALRKIGLALIPASAVAAAGPVLTSQDVAGRVARQLGVPVAAADWPASNGTVTLAEMGTRTARALGGNPAGPQVVTSLVPAFDPARRALLLLGVNPQDVAGLASGAATDFAALAKQALAKLTVTAADEMPSNEDQALATSQVVAVHDALVSLDYVAWPLSAVPLSVAPHYIAMTAHLLGPYFGLPGNAEAYAEALEMIRRQALTGPVAQARAENRVATVHDMLVSAGLATWLLNAIPLALADAYASMTAALLAPVFGKAPDPAAQDATMAAARRFVLSGYRGQALAEQEVAAAHDALVTQGIVSWPLAAVPVAHAAHYVTMASATLAPALGVRQDAPDRQVSRADYEAAESSIRKAAVIAGVALRAADRVRAIASELSALGLADWDADHIPAYLADAVTDLAVQQMGPEFGKPFDLQMYAAMESRIRRTVMGGPLGQALAEQKVKAVHADLEARGRVRWTLYGGDLPVWAEEPYVSMAAALLAPEFEVKADPNLWQMGDMMLTRGISVPSLRRPVVVPYF